MGAKYTLDPVAFRENLLNAEWMVALMHSRAEEGAAFARSIAPVDEESDHPGRYKAGIGVESGRDGGVHHDRAYGRVTASAPESRFVEFGTEHNDAHHVLIATLDVLSGWSW